MELLVVERLKAVDGGGPFVVALALDLQGRGDQFFDQVVVACRQHGIGFLLRVRSAWQPVGGNPGCDHEIAPSTPHAMAGRLTEWGLANAADNCTKGCWASCCGRGLIARRR